MSLTFKVLLDFYIFFGIIVFILTGYIFLMTKKFNKKKIRLLGMFHELSKTQCMLLSTNLLSIIITLYSIIKIQNFGTLFMAMLGVNALIAILSSFNLHTALVEFIYSSINIIVLYLLSLVNSYITNVNYDKATTVLCIVLGISIVVFVAYASTRKLELLYKNNKYIRE